MKVRDLRAMLEDKDGGEEVIAILHPGGYFTASTELIKIADNTAQNPYIQLVFASDISKVKVSWVNPLDIKRE